jgi:ribonuclease HI
MFKHTEKDTKKLIVAITYGIWYARNQLIFQEKFIPPFDVCTIAVTQLQEYQKLIAAKPSPHRNPSTGDQSNNTCWSPPPRGAWKINVDAHLSSDGHWFSGLLLRRSDGSAVGAATQSHLGSIQATFGEAMGLKDALDFVEKLQVYPVIFELDSQIIVNAVKKKMKVRRDWGFVVDRCVEFLKHNPNSSINWVNRRANRAAHVLARWAEESPNNEWINSVPYFITSYIQKDISTLYHE